MRKSRVTLAAVLTAALLTGCQGLMGGSAEFSPEVSSVYVEKDGAVLSALVEEFEDQAQYDQESFQAFLEETVSRFNEERGTGGSEQPSVTLRSCSLENGRAQAVFEYGGADDLLAFARETGDDSVAAEQLAVFTVADGLSRGEVIGTSFYKPDGSAVANETVTKQSGAMAVAVTGSVRLQTEGKILYVTEGVTLEDDNRAVTPEGTSYIIFK